MKLFLPTGEVIEHRYTMQRQDKPNALAEEIAYTQERLAMNDDTVAYLLDESKSGSTISRIRQFIAYLYNADYYPAPNLFSLMRNSDEDHAELIVNFTKEDLEEYLQSGKIDKQELVKDLSYDELLDVIKIDAQTMAEYANVPVGTIEDWKKNKPELITTIIQSLIKRNGA